MKKIILLAAICFMSIGAFAQAPLENGATQLNAGLGTSGWGTPIYVGLDYGVGNDFTVGGELSFRSYKESYGVADYSSSIISIAANGNYHFNTLLDIPSEWDFYAGLGLGYYIWNIDNDYPGSNNSGIGIGAQIGGRYFFNDNFGVNLELGGANVTSGAKIGITYKL